MDRKSFARRRHLTTIALVAVSLFLWPLASRAQWLTPPTSTNQLNFNFDAELYGSYAGAPPKMYADIYPSAGAGNNSSVTIGTAPGMAGKAAILSATANNSTLNYAYLDMYPADGATPTVLGKNGIFQF